VPGRRWSRVVGSCAAPPARASLTVAAGLAIALSLAACGGDSTSLPPSSPTIPQDGSLAGELDAIRARHGVPALAAFSIHGGRIVEQAAVGLRAVGHPEGVTVDDRWHLGSLTKAMTSTLAAVLVEQGTISWTTTIADVFPDLAMRPEYRTVRLEELVTHTGGVHTDITRTPSWTRLSSSPDPLPVQRLVLVAEMLAMSSDASRGSYAYSNGGYVVAGAMLETVTGRDWESLMTQRVFAPLGMASTGFGPPGSVSAPDQPWGHLTSGTTLTPLEPGPDADNPAAIGPAGTVHSTFADLALYFALHLDGGAGRPTALLSAESFQKLHRPAPGSEYAAGWGVAERSWAAGEVLQHHGSNTFWWASVWLAPNRNLGFFAVSNVGGDPAFEASDEAVSALLRRFEASASGR
jgi:CubicO group peptidase (beta-lactamase class C family)